MVHVIKRPIFFVSDIHCFYGDHKTVWFFSEVGFALIWWTGVNKVWLYQSSAESCSACSHCAISESSPYIPMKLMFLRWGVYLYHSYRNELLNNLKVCVPDNKRRLWWFGQLWQTVQHGSSSNSHFYIVITTVDSSPALKRVQMWIVSISLIAACRGVHDRWEIVWFVLVGKKQKKSTKETSDAPLSPLYSCSWY